MTEKQTILRHADIELVMRRLAYQIAENHVDTNDILFIGLNDRGKFIADQIYTEIGKIFPAKSLKCDQMIVTNELVVPTINPTPQSTVIIIDDVINSGFSAMKAIQYFFQFGCSGIETVFLAEREHRAFPVLANYVGISIATTLKDHVYFNNTNTKELEIYLA